MNVPVSFFKIQIVIAILISLLPSAVNAQDEVFELYVPKFEPGYRPDNSTDEGGFWYQVDKIEQEVKKSPLLITDPELNAYVKGIVCKLTPEYCEDIRVYIVRNPHFNASMYPNGMMHVWTGLLMRADSEAQLAAVLGHEIAHYLGAHSITQWRKIRSGLATAMVFDTLLTGGLATLAVAGSSTSFSRNQEQEADLFGLHLLESAGYNPSKASEFWQYIIEESDKDQSKSSYSSFWSSHPRSEKRARELLMRGEAIRRLDKEYVSNQSDYVFQLSDFYLTFMEDHMNMQEFGQSEALLARHEQLGFPSSQVQFLFGEMYRLRNEDDDLSKAVASYKASIQQDDAPTKSYRELGYLLVKMRDPEALTYLKLYKQKDPQASDMEMVNFYISSLAQ